MGKGDKRSRRGKIWRGSFGNTRRKKNATKPAFVPKPKAKKVVKPLEVNIAEAPVLETAELAQTEVKVAKPKKAAAPKKPKAEGEKKAPAKKKAPAEKKKAE